MIYKIRYSEYSKKLRVKFNGNKKKNISKKNVK